MKKYAHTFTQKFAVIKSHVYNKGFNKNTHTYTPKTHNTPFCMSQTHVCLLAFAYTPLNKFKLTHTHTHSDITAGTLSYK